MSLVTTKRWLGRCASVAVLMGIHAGGGAAQGSSDEGAIFLLLPVGADAISMGRAVTAMPGPESAFWNPAGLASVGRSQVVLSRGSGSAGVSSAASVLLRRAGVGTLGVSYQLLDVGDQDYTDVNDNVLGTISTRNHLAVISAAAELLPGLDAGVSFKAFAFRRSCRGNCVDVGTTSVGYAVDAGVQLMPLGTVPLRLGAMVAHLGPRFQHENASQADPLPTRIRVAAAYDVLRHLHRQGLQGWVTAELQGRRGYESSPSLYLGSEVSAGEDDVLYLRLGYATRSDELGGVSVGLGLRSDRYGLSVAKALAASPLDGTYDPLTISFSVGL